jgi:hypothetical protein
MKPAWSFLVLLLAFAIPVEGQAKPASDVDSLLRSASERLDHYQQQIAPDIRCADENEEALRFACEVYLEKVNSAVQDAATKIADYRGLTSPQSVNLFDIYEDFHRIMDNLELLAAYSEAHELHSQRNHDLFTDSYNNFIKLTGWFGDVVRERIEQTDQCSAR